MKLVDLFLKLAAAADKLAQGPAKLRPLDLDADWPQIERLMTLEQWPFLRSDLAVGAAQPRGVSHVAEVNGAFAGFFTTHAFDRVGYLDMMIIDPAFRGQTVARPLYLQTLRTLQDQGIEGLVVHTTNDSARLVTLLGFQAGMDFTLLERPAGTSTGAPKTTSDRAALLTLDAQIFGAPRTPWLDALLDEPSVRFVTLEGASLCLRPRAGGALCLDAVNSPDDDALRALVDHVVQTCGDHTLQCFARTGSALHAHLQTHGFQVPAFFVPIGPLVEWRQGKTRDLGTSDRVQSLMWL